MEMLVLASVQAVVVSEAGVRKILLASGCREAVGRSKERVDFGFVF